VHASGICKDLTTNVVRNVRDSRPTDQPSVARLTTESHDVSRRVVSQSFHTNCVLRRESPLSQDACSGASPAEKLTGIESQNKVIIQIHDDWGAQETGRRAGRVNR